MISSWILLGIAMGALLWVGAAALHDAQRAAGRPLRWVWAGMMAATVLLTALLPLRRPAVQKRSSAPASLSALMVPSDRPVAAMSRWRSAAARAASMSAAPMAVAQSALARVERSTPPAAELAVAATWAAASLVGLVLLGATYRRTLRMRRRWPTHTLLDTPVRVSDDAGPAVVGVAPMEIVVPTWILARAQTEQRLVLAHELEHVRARDPWLLVAGCVAVAAMPWNPFLWLALSRLRLSMELDCDRRVLRAGAAPARYGKLLLDLSEHRSSLASALPALSYSTSHLERRLLAMTTRKGRFTGARRAGGILLTTAALLAACESRLPTSADIDAMDAKSATKSAALTGADTTRLRYTVDELRVTQEQAMRIASDSISSIEVVKDTKPGGETQVRLRTMRTRDTISLIASKIALTEGSLTPLRRKSPSPEMVDVALAPTPRQDRVALRSKTAFTGLFVIDGKIVSDTVANSLSPDRIASIEVVKGNTAKLLYGDPRAADGVIVVTTKKR